MEMNFEEHVQERAVLVGLNADCFRKEQTATEETLEELDALLETARQQPDEAPALARKAQEMIRTIITQEEDAHGI